MSAENLCGRTSVMDTFLRVAVCVTALIGGLVGCGGAGSSSNDTSEPITMGNVFPPASGLVFVEYDASGAELQRSTESSGDGQFQFSRPLSGSRVEALYTDSANRVAPVYSLQLSGFTRVGHLEVTPLTTWYDQLVVNGTSRAEAAASIGQLLTANCKGLVHEVDETYFHGTTTVAAADHDWLLEATSGYLFAARQLGLGPKVDVAGWASALDRHGETLSRLCAFARAVSSPEWAVEQAAKLKQTGKVAVVDNVLLASAISGARAEGLEVLAKQIQQTEYPEQTVVLQAPEDFSGKEVVVTSDLVTILYLQSQAAQARADTLVALQVTQGVALSPTGAVVRTLQTSTVSTSTAAVRLENNSPSDKSVRLALNGTEVADLSSVIAQIVSLPVAYPNEPLYRKAWRYVMAHRRDTQPLAISFFQFQPDLWLRSVGSSYCEAQASVLYRLWRSMGYEARVHALTGHVTAEILIDNRWQVFDPFLGVYYTNRLGQIVGVAELEQDPSLITAPQTPLLPLDSIAYSEVVAKVFATSSDNYVGYDYMGTEPDPLGNEIEIPAGGYLELSAATDVKLPSTEAGYQVEMSTMKLWIPPGFTGNLRLPLLLLGIEGAGAVQLLGRTVDSTGALIETRGLAGLGYLDASATDPDIHARLQWFYFHDSSEVGVSEVQVKSSGPGGLLLTLMVNPLFFGTPTQLDVRAEGSDVDGLQFVAAPAPTQIQ